MAWPHAGLYGPEDFEYPSGVPAPGADFEVRDGGVLIDLYVDRDRSDTTANPGTLDSRGNLSFYADPGVYVLTVQGDGAPATMDVLVTPDPTDLDALVDPNSHHHVQSVAATTWTINHPLPFEPSVTVVDGSGNQFQPNGVHHASGVVTVTMAIARTGDAFLS